MEQDTKLRVPIFECAPDAAELKAEIGEVSDLQTALRWSLAGLFGEWVQDGRAELHEGRKLPDCPALRSAEEAARARGFKIEYYRI